MVRPSGDALFPSVDWSQWREVSSEELPMGAHDDYRARLVVLDRL
ncbi:MAG: hypothetical protein WDN31_13635 [Hyphomicrobium sp.]